MCIDFVFVKRFDIDRISIDQTDKQKDSCVNDVCIYWLWLKIQKNLSVFSETEF